jgi:2-amino-4-hydroxy-6-hydroxymethyldihydropteridine diphosphokinase
MPPALIALGSNLGDRQRLLEAAVQRLAATPGVRSVSVSKWHETRAVGGPSDQPQYLNGAALIETSLSPEALLGRLEQIEQELGRDRQERWGPRTIDLDLLLFDQLVKRTPTLTLPHPRMALRRFVLEPAAQIAGSMVHPTIGWSVAQLLQHLRTAMPYVAISSAGLGGLSVDVSRQLAVGAAKKLGWRIVESSGSDDEIPPLDSPSLSLSWAIEFLRTQAKLLARADWPTELPGTISTFWIEDLLALGDVLWPGKLDSAWQALSATVVTPKLLVMHSEPAASSDDQLLRQRVAVATQTRAARREIGPVLWLESADPSAAQAELIAIIEGMS